jgi:hypothetical protein
MTNVLTTNQAAFYKYLLAFTFFLLPFFAFSQLQLNGSEDTTKYKVIEASKNYNKDLSYQKKWGTHYRKEWGTPVKVRIANLDTLAGGLIPYQSGGGRQSKSLRLKDKDGREYVLRSVDKSFGKALPEIYQGTFIESIINDQVTIGHPYGPLTIPTLADAAGVYHTNPQLVFIPEQPALDSFNKDFGNQLYMLEQRPDENWETAANFGNSKNIIGTEKMLEELLEDNDHHVDQLAYVRARLFDFFIGDWGRHEDQWRWASFKNDNEKIFKPIPRDRDQAYTKFDGSWLKTAIAVADLNHLQSFDNTIKDVTTYGFTARNLDRRVANEPSLKQWIGIAKDLQHSLTDAVIEQAIKQLPGEVFTISGKDIIEKLRSRRSHLVEYATTYYKFLAKEVDIVGSDKKELFQVNRINDNETLVKVYKLKVEGDSTDKLIYERKFYSTETNEIRLYGMNSDDVFVVKGNTSKGILIRIIGGGGDDLLEDSSIVAGRRKLTHVYDNDKNSFEPAPETRLHISNDSVLNNYQYNTFKYDKKGFRVEPGFVSLTLGYGMIKHKWQKYPAGMDQSFKIKYSINRGAALIDYRANFYQLFGKWNAFVGAGAGVPNVVNFFGIGNESSFENYTRKYYRLRSHEYYGRFGINRSIGHSQVEVGGLYQTIRIMADSNRYVTTSKDGGNSLDLERKHFVSGNITYRYQKADHPIIPEKGFRFISSAAYIYNFNEPDHSFTRLTSDAAVYIPVWKFISLAVRAGGAANIGDAEFYQLNMLGSHDNLRGFRKYRFYGKQSFYNNNELRFIFDAKNKVFNGKYGLLGFFDNGRVWYPGENSNTWHAGYGIGAFLSLFNKVVISGAYGISKDDRVASVYFGFYF